MQASSVRPFATLSKCRQHLAQVSSTLTGTSTSIPAYILQSHEHVQSVYNADEDLVHEDSGGQRRSQEAQDGSSRIGMVELPTELQLAVARLIEDADKPQVRQKALKLYEYFRASSAAAVNQKGKKTARDDEPAPQMPFIDGNTSLAYAAGVMPSAYAATLAVMTEAQQRLSLLSEDGEEPWKPQKIVDWGAGLGTVALAAHQVWPGHQLSYISLDASRAMQALSSSLLSTISAESLRKKLFQTSVGNPDLLQMVDSTFPDVPLERTMAVAAYTLGDMPTDKIRREVVRSLWDSGAEVIVVIDRGTPRGFDIVANAREQLLRLGRHAQDESNVSSIPSSITNVDDVDADVLPDEDPDVIEFEGETYYAEGTEGAANLMGTSDERGCYIVAPCPHDGACPLHKTKGFCHFSQKVQRPAFLRKTKHSGQGEESSSYSYFILKRGSRPTTDVRWPRLVLPPLKRGGHVILDGCCPSGDIERFTVAKSTGKQEYYDARKSKWGDSFPHYVQGKAQRKSRGMNR